MLIQVKKLMIEKQVSNEQLAKELGITSSRLSRLIHCWEPLKKTDELAIKIANFFNTKTENIFSE